MVSDKEVQAQPDNSGGPFMRQLVLDHLREQGFAAARGGRRERAQAYLQRALALDGEDADLWATLGSVSTTPSVRIACARRALHLEPQHAEAQHLLEEGFRPPDTKDPSSLSHSRDPFRLPAPSLQPGAGTAIRLQPRKTVRSVPTLASAVALPRAGNPAPTATLLQPRPAAPAMDQPTLTLSPLVIARLIAGLVLVLLLALNVGLVNAYNRRYEDRFYPSVRIAGLQVGGLFRSEAASLIEGRIAPSLDQGIILVYGEQSWTVTAAQVGLRYRIEEACEKAWTLGRHSWWERERLEWDSPDIPLEAEARAGRLNAILDQVSASINRPAIAPTILWQDDHWEIAPGQDGRQVLRDDLADNLVYVLTLLASGERPPEGSFIVVDVPTITETATLSPETAAQIQRQLDRIGQPLTLHCEGHSWTLEAADLAAWTRVELLSPAGDAALKIDRLALRDHLSTLAPEIARPVERPRIEVNSDGRVTAFQTGQPGLRLELGEAANQVEQALRRRLAGEAVASVELPTEVLPPGDDALMNELGVVEFVGEGTSTFVGSSSARSTNILIGGQELHGRLIGPGEVFSFNAAIDPVTWEKGYQMSPIIIGGGVVMGLGGGLCQVATTFYRAALYTGLEIVERHPHAWRVDWYEQDAPPGFDATIAIGGPDLKVRNNTGHYLLIQVDTRLDLGYQTFRFYGTSPDWNVTVDNVSIMSGGHDVSYVRTVTDAEGTVLWQETIYSHYQ